MPSPLLDGDPTRIGPYRLHGRLGGGGMGLVYLGLSPGGRPVAVKVVRPALAEDADFRRRFAQEVRAARRVGGFYTAQVVDADTEAAAPWMATAYIPGPSLHQAVADHGPLPAASVAVLGAGLAEGLGAVHACRLVHRDLKPGNVILAADGPRLIDFGIARATDTLTYTSHQPVIGTAGFMSPEQGRGEEVAPPSDVFALGCVLAFAATGRSPFGTGPAEAVVYRIVREEPDLSGVPAPLAGLVAECLAKEPGARPGLERVLGLLAAPAPCGGGRAREGWLPDDLTAAVTRQETRLLTLVETARRDPAAAGPAPAATPPTGLAVGNLTPAGLDVVCDDAVLGTVPPFASAVFPVAAGTRTVRAGGGRGPGAARRVEVPADGVERVVFGGGPGGGGPPKPVGSAVFSPARAAAVAGSGLGCTAAAAAGMAVLTVLVMAAQALAGEEFRGNWPDLLLFCAAATALGGALGAFLRWRSPSARLVVGRDALAFTPTPGLDHRAPVRTTTVRWCDLTQASLVEHRRATRLVVWPRPGAPRPEGEEVQGGVAVCRAAEVGAGGGADARRLRAALRWFADGVYLEQAR
ncbi:serine/threonine protein kinase [Streptomonospora sp. S1-112]|uniref:Serine/threonine protein kinase n=1 Tax=Streptomonospora mangrovi TaxID=2883123 RepID=A0A9X3NLK5_9ACTN|nr:serine/threonine-protein kinase [Streptomonospora mangrovi]MDA0565712.1 serine/threonine protein kinase [Streptomonospora mangrovi]